MATEWQIVAYEQACENLRSFSAEYYESGRYLVLVLAGGFATVGIGGLDGLGGVAVGLLGLVAVGALWVWSERSTTKYRVWARIAVELEAEMEMDVRPHTIDRAERAEGAGLARLRGMFASRLLFSTAFVIFLGFIVAAAID